jgi:hypothetical protein
MFDKFNVTLKLLICLQKINSCLIVTSGWIPGAMSMGLESFICAAARTK